uniref:Mitochondrial GTPase 1 n=1 Tax=Acanthochromis polyacanthus TaxID=80966 RepID=A0A3Q1EH86_9TELE
MRLQQVLRNVDKFRTVFDFGGRDVAHWFPGHMAKGLRQMRANLKKVDCIIEIHDHIPFSGRNPVFQDTLNVKPHLLILNKMDLTDLSNKQRILKTLEKNGVKNVLFTDCLKQRDDNIKKLVPMVMEIIERHPRYNREEVCERPRMYLLDTPGVLPPKIENVETGMKLALCGTILDHLVGEDIIADYLLYSLNRLRKFSYVEKYDLQEPSDDIQQVLKRIAVKLGKTQRVKAITGVGNITIMIPNYTAAAYDFIRAFRKGELGQVMLD